MAKPRDDEDDFLAFWSTRQRRTCTILGVEVVVPSPDTTPIEFDALMAEFVASDVDGDDVDALQMQATQMEQLLQVLFGDGVFDQWKVQGLTRGMLQVLFAWGMTNAAGKPTSFEEASDLADEAEAAKTAGKALNRAGRRARASSRTAASGRAGRTSSRTSAVSTASRRKG